MGDEEQEQRLFNLRDAEQLLPLFEELLGGALEKKKRVDEIEREFSQVQNRILLYGGILPPYGALAEKKLERDNLTGGIRDAVAQIEQTGCVVKDVDLGLVDFPSLVDQEQVYLCWKLGERRIGFWHRMDEGFAGRKPLGPSKAGPSDAAKPN